jgi:hypothetical protein
MRPEPGARQGARFLDAFYAELTGIAGRPRGGRPWGAEEDDAGDADVAAFAATLGAEWARRVRGAPTAEEKAQQLVADHRATLEGARARFAGAFKKGQMTDEQITRAWKTSREQELRFRVGSPGVAALSPFTAPPEGIELVARTDLVAGSDRAPIAPLAVAFVEALRRRTQLRHAVSTYRGHGGGGFLDRGHSLDLFLGGVDTRGFYPPDRAVEFLHAVHDAAREAGAEWRAIYNDFTVADAVNRALGRRHVIFVGKPTRGGLNWHGPAPLILHFHLDLTPRAGGSASTWRTPAGAPAAAATPAPAAPPSPAPAPAPGAAAAPPAPRVAVEPSVVAAVERFRGLVDAAAARYGVESALIRGVMAAESSGNPDVVAPSGYTGLMQAGTDASHKDPATSIDAGTKKLRDFRKLMDDVLTAQRRRYAQLPGSEQLRLLALAYNAGPVTVAKALQYAADAGAPERWLDAAHYRRALLFTGAYSLRTAAPACLPGASGPERKEALRLGLMVRDHWRFGKKRTPWRKLPDPPSWADMAPLLPPLVTCAIAFKHDQSPRYAARILAYRDHFLTLP